MISRSGLALRELSGWGRTAPSTARVFRPNSCDDLVTKFADLVGSGVVTRGLGRSYGDAAQCDGGVVIDMTGLRTFRWLDVDGGLIRADAGLSLGDLSRVILPLGWYLPVTPGTRFVTVGGAIASNIHGKNHHRDGSFARYIERITILAPTGIHELRPRSDPDGFWATAGGMGLTGAIIDADLRLLRVETSYIRADTRRCPDLDDVMMRMTEGDQKSRYSVAWIDLIARGRQLGRSILIAGEHASWNELPTKLRPFARHYSPRAKLKVPSWFPSGMLRRTTAAAFNELWFRKAPKLETGRIQTLESFFHPLDSVLEWNRLYGNAGFFQYQFVVPFGAERALREIVEAMARSGCPSFLCVLKRLGTGDPFLSFPIPGWTLALDVPADSPGIMELLDRFDASVAAAGGRVYLAKDSRLRAESMMVMYPQLNTWRRVRAKFDPKGELRSDLATRLALTTVTS